MGCSSTSAWRPITLEFSTFGFLSLGCFFFGITFRPYSSSIHFLYQSLEIEQRSFAVCFVFPHPVGRGLAPAAAPLRFSPVGPDALIGPLRCFSAGYFAACRRRVPLPMAARRRKVRLSPFPPNGENCARSLAPPLPSEPAVLGFAGRNGRLNKPPPGTAPMSTLCS